MFLIEITTNFTELSKDLERFRIYLGEELAKTQQVVTTEVRVLCRQLTPYVTGKLFKGWKKVVYAKGSPPNEWIGTVWNPTEYFKDVEEGQKPGNWCAIEPLKQWCQIVLGEEGLAYAVRWKIFRQGTQGKHILPQVKGATQDSIEKNFEEALVRVKERWDSGE